MSMRLTIEALSVLLPAGALGSSVVLASAPASALAVSNHAAALGAAPHVGVAARLQAIRDGVSAMVTEGIAAADDRPEIVKAWWGNGHWGWHNGGWGWHNGGWGWHNGGWGWHNGGWGWPNGGLGWHNGGWGWPNGGWHNFWHNF
jgi:rSAM-associated Gly-rich repeat protein